MTIIIAIICQPAEESVALDLLCALPAFRKGFVVK
jgi:hypothetical protein